MKNSSLVSVAEGVVQSPLPNSTASYGVSLLVIVVSVPMVVSKVSVKKVLAIDGSLKKRQSFRLVVPPNSANLKAVQGVLALNGLSPGISILKTLPPVSPVYSQSTNPSPSLSSTPIREGILSVNPVN